MFIKNFDFLNSPIQLFFFEKKTNKTLLGGILFIIYILSMLTIVIFYVINYCLNDKYEVRYSRYKYYSRSDIYNQNNEKDNFFNFSYNFYKFTTEYEQEELDHNFFLMNSEFEPMNRNEFNISKIEETAFYITYLCIGNCSFDSDEDIVYYMDINYTGYKIDHQNEKTPLDTHDSNNTFTKTLFFTSDKTNIYTIDFEVIKYKEEKGLLGLFDNWMNKKNEFSCIDIGSIDKTEAKNFLYLEFGESDMKFIFQILAVIVFSNDKHEIEEYIRKKMSILDIFANIGSLFSTFLTIFSFLFKFYSEKNNNYTIIKELLSSPKINSNSKINISKAKTIKLENISKKNKNYLNFDKKSIDTSKSVPFKMENDNIINNNNKINTNNENIIKQKEENDNIIILDKICFIDFLLDNFNCKKIKKKKSHIIIDICDKIIAKYISIETILYNQIILENLLKDYQWNDPSIKKISDNFLFRKLKSIT